MTTANKTMMAALNRLCKWRMILAGWQLGTRPETDSESQAVRDHRDATLILRAEVSALFNLLLEKGLFTHEEFMAQVAVEADHYCQSFEKRFPGAKATDVGMDIDLTLACEWLDKFPR